MTDVQIRITALVDQFNQNFLEASKRVSGLGKELDQAASKLQRASDNMAKSGKALSMYLTAPLVGLGALAVKEFGEAERITNKLNATLLATGQASEKNLKALEASNRAIEMQTTLEDDEIATLQTLALNMGINVDKTEEATKAAIGLSKTYGIDTSAAMKLVSAAMNGNYDKLGKLIPAIKACGTEQEKQAMYSRLVANGYKIAQSETEGFFGKLNKLQKTVKNLAEDFGAFVVDYLNPLINKVQEAATSFGNLDSGTKKNIVTAALLVAAIGPLLIVVSKAIMIYRAYLLVSAAFSKVMAGQSAATGASTISLIANRVAMIANKAATTQLTLASIKDTVATVARTVATNALRIAMMLLSPVNLAIAGTVGVMAIAYRSANYELNRQKELLSDATQNLNDYKSAANGKLSVSEDVSGAAEKIWKTRTVGISSSNEQQKIANELAIEYNRKVIDAQKEIQRLNDLKAEGSGKGLTLKQGLEKKRYLDNGYEQDLEKSKTALAQNMQYISFFKSKVNAIEDKYRNEKSDKDNDSAQKWAQEQERLKTKYSNFLKTIGKDEIEIEKEKLEEELKDLQVALARGAVLEKDAYTIKMNLAQDSAEKLNQIKQKQKEEEKAAANARIDAWQTATGINTNVSEKFAAIQKQLNAGSIKNYEATAMQIAAVFTSALSAVSNLMSALFSRQEQEVEAKYSKLTDEEQAYQDYQEQQDAAEYSKMSTKQKKEHNLKAAADKAAAEQEKKKAKELRKIHRQEAIANKVVGIAEAGINTALGISRALADYIFPYSAIVGGLVAGLGAIQIATIAATPLPEMATGGIVYANGKGGTAVKLAETEHDEFVVPDTDLVTTTLSDRITKHMTNKFKENTAIPTSQTTQVINIQPADVYLGMDKIGKIIFSGTSSGQILIDGAAVV